MKKLTIIFCVLVMLASLSYFAISYIGGRMGMLELTLLGIVPFLLNPIALLCLLIVGLIALVKGRDRTTVVVCLGLAAVFSMLPFLLNPEKLFQAGVRDRVVSQVTPKELRQLATRVQAALPENGSLPGPMKKSLWSEEYRKQWEELVRDTEIEKLDPWMVIFNRNQSVEINWGGARSGHWGVTIDTGSEMKPGDIAPGINTFVAEH